MMKDLTKETKQEYIKRINYVLDFIEKNLDKDLSLEQLSKKAHYSPYHFHRVFSTVVNEKLNEYVIRKRVERIASVLLVNSNKAIKELVYTYGFNSESSFSRAFKKYYGISPTTFKLEGKTTLSKIGIAPFSSEKYICSLDNISKWTAMNGEIRVKELQEITLAAKTQIGDFGEIGTMFSELIEWGNKIQLLATSGFKAITIYHDNPNVTHIPKVRYSVCIAVNSAFETDKEIRPIVIPKGHFAVGNFEIEAKDFPKAWKSMFMWILENNYTFRDGDYFESYLNDHKTHPKQKFIIDICIPVLKHKKEVTSENISKKANQQPKGSISAVENSLFQDILITSNTDTSLNIGQVTTFGGNKKGAIDFHQCLEYMKEIRAFFDKEYALVFTLGTIYKGNADFSYFSLTTEELKKQKLKFVIIFNHKLLCFTICLSGQNKEIRKQCWKLFKDSSWDTYKLVTSINDSLFIMDHTLVAHPNFDDITTLKKDIETESLKFINDIRSVLEINN